jgi:hypothetical protein
LSTCNDECDERGIVEEWRRRRFAVLGRTAFLAVVFLKRRHRGGDERAIQRRFAHLEKEKEKYC